MAKKKLKKGLLITFEGVEGCGKSTHARLIYTFLKKCGYNVIYIREPGGTRIGEKIRKVLLDAKNKEMSQETELFLFEANRAQIVEEVIKPALKKNKIIIGDRFFDSTTAYQGYADGIDIKFIEEINRFASGGITPDLTIVLDIKPEMGLRKVIQKKGKKDRMERKKLSYHSRVRRGYRKLANSFKERITLIKVRRGIGETQNLIRKEVLQILVRG